MHMPLSWEDVCFRVLTFITRNFLSKWCVWNLQLYNQVERTNFNSHFVGVGFFAYFPINHQETPRRCFDWFRQLIRMVKPGSKRGLPPKPGTDPPGNDRISHLWKRRNHLPNHLFWGDDCGISSVDISWGRFDARRMDGLMLDNWMNVYWYWDSDLEQAMVYFLLYAELKNHSTPQIIGYSTW